ncbi:hypothetical protein D3C84_1014580 [compost metagenome]
MQRAAVKFAKTQFVTQHQSPSPVTEQAGLAAVQVKLQAVIGARQAGQGIRPGDPFVVPQQEVLAGAVAQRSPWRESKAQDIGRRPIKTDDIGL